MDIEGTIQFIINQQAQFAADIARLEENLAKLGESTSKHDARLDQIGETMLQITEVVSATAITQQNTNAILEKLAERMVELSGQQAHTDERLNALIAIVERHLSDHP